MKSGILDRASRIVPPPLLHGILFLMLRGYSATESRYLLSVAKALLRRGRF